MSATAVDVRPGVATSSSPIAEFSRNWQLWKQGLRVVIVVLCLSSIGCVASATATGLHQFDHYVWDWQDVPWVLIPVRQPPIIEA